MYPTIIPIKIADVFINPLVKFCNTIITKITTVPTIKCFGDPKSAEPAPPAKYLIPTGSNESPIEITTKLVTIGGNNFLNGLMKNPKTISNTAPTNEAPIIAEYPYVAPIAFCVPINPELVPITTGNPLPTLKNGYNWINVAIPATNIEFWINIDFVSNGISKSPHTIISGDTFPKNIANTCWIPNGIACFKGTLPSNS